ncbi:MAG: hypothetical protein ABL877_10810 [Thiobacillus sp.]
MAAIVKVKGVPFDFNGRVLVIPPLTLGAYEQLQQRLAEFPSDVRDQASIETTIDSVHAALRRNYPDMTREEVGGLVDFSNMQDVMACTMDVAGLKRKALEAELGDKPGE